MTPDSDSSRSLIGRSTQIGQVRQMIDKLKRSNVPVLLLGESGTGKEVAARAIHANDPRKPFIPIDCGSLVGALMESELFGHAKGAFTGAHDNKRGLIDLADEGIAFFDEIGDLPLDMQVKLLRLLQEQQFRPVGGLAQKKINIRVVAATHRDLAKKVADGSFRQDLFYRLNVVTVRLPSLRDRKEDIPALIDYFLGRLGKPYSLGKETLDVLLNYDWPGNIRELENCIRRMAALNSGPLLQIADLPTILNNHRLIAQAKLHSIAASVSSGGFPSISSRTKEDEAAEPFPSRGSFRSLADMERCLIIDALKHSGGDRAAAANLLGIGRTTLYRKLKEYGQ